MKILIFIILAIIFDGLIYLIGAAITQDWSWHSRYLALWILLCMVVGVIVSWLND